MKPPIRPRTLYVLAALVPLACAVPTLAMGYLREDWLLLWHALDPAAAPEGSTGVFARPLALGLWKLAVALGGDAPLAMHVAMLLLCLLLALFVAQLTRRAVAVDERPEVRRGTGLLAPLAAAAIVGSHAALLELRLWAAAGNGLLAAVLATAGVSLLWPRHGGTGTAGAAHARAAAEDTASHDVSSPAGWGGRQIAGWGLVLLAGLARVDAWALLIVPIAGGVSLIGRGPASSRTGWRWSCALVALLGVVALVAMQRSGGGWGFHPDHAGQLLRRLVVPWGAPLPKAVAIGLGPAGLGLLIGAAFRARGVMRGAVLATLAVLAASAVVPWSPAGRYLLVPVISLAVAIGVGLNAGWLETGGRRRSAVIPLAVLGGWLALNVASGWAGNTARDLRRRSAAETALYEAMQEHAREDIRTIVLLDAPPMGWRSDERDAENVASAALLRQVDVELRETEAPAPDTEVQTRDTEVQATDESAPAADADLALRFHPDGTWRVVSAPR